MKAAFDVHYTATEANAAALVFDDWKSESPVSVYTASVPGCGDYAAGEFYLRELKPLLAVITAIREPISTYVIDGYCYLSEDHDPGLGAHLPSI